MLSLDNCEGVKQNRFLSIFFKNKAMDTVLLLN